MITTTGTTNIGLGTRTDGDELVGMTKVMIERGVDEDRVHEAKVAVQRGEQTKVQI